MTRNGKIARLPGGIRSELNARMENGEETESLLAWLNGLPVAQEMLKAKFEGAPLNKQNLSEWRLGGFREWQLRQEWLEQAKVLEDAVEEIDQEMEAQSLPRLLAGVLAVRYAALLNGWNGEVDEKIEGQLRLLRGMVRDVALLQRTLERASRLERDIDREEEERERRELEEIKSRTLRTLWSVTQRGSLVRAFGGGKLGERMADIIEAVENDRPIPAEAKEDPPSRRRGGAASGGRKKEERGGKKDEGKRTKEEGEKEQAPTGSEGEAATAAGQSESGSVRVEEGS